MDPNQPIPAAPPIIATPTEIPTVMPPAQSPRPKTKYILPLVIGAVVVISIVAALAAIGLSKKDSAMTIPTPPAFQTATPVQTYPVVFENGTEGSQQTAVIRLQQGSRIPNAFHLEIDFDPQQVAINSIKTGEVWEESNELNTKIENGKLVFDAGQGFGTKQTGSLELVIISYTPKTSTPFQLTIGSGSRLGFVGENQLSPIATGTLTITP